MRDENSCENAIAREGQIREKVDSTGTKWQKIYVGSGAHADNWIQQCIEIYGADNLQIEEVQSPYLKCYQDGAEKQLRIWLKVEKES